ncbi:leucine-rich repeat neuronal protein 1-like isoform X2 [Homalodisca vitripennis]|uniref:leucine-rich repeat neuronal protein 1-like isoform X1 n=1 Tax=Homalodisca vitripennis TaxID=197043 RepID=UPI001EEC9DE0|nr:leucine-rich repeat neuronal protein 1-like isoform X1 [Homalodisca vitripennis]XP_046662576.1 leucine-rich repeat neuronal protein 1-like isoform X2 [Homalodisca vitripennis]
MGILITVCVLVGFMAFTEADLCHKCICDNEHLDCSFIALEDHFNDSDWAGSTHTIISFDHNNIIHLKAFPKLPVTKLSITHNMIVKIDPACFKELENLTELDLGHNHLTSEQLVPAVFQGHYAPETYEPLRNLRVLKLSANALHTLDADLFEHMPQLEHLSLDSNPLRIIDRQTMVALTSISFLKELDLSSTSLKEFPPHLLHTPRFLEVLNLSSNLFTSPPESLEDSHFLKQLHIDENPIVNISKFPNLPYLEVLSMSWMPDLVEIGPEAMNDLVSLQEFYCSHNPKLEKINATAFSKSAVSSPGGQTWPPIKKITLNNNNLGFLDFELLGHWDRLDTVDIQNNPWVCECHNQWLVSTLVPMMEKLNSTQHMVAGIVCHWPEQMRGQSVAELDHRSYHMRCLDAYDHHPEKDGTLLIGILIGVILAVPLTALVFISYRRHLRTTAAQYHRAFYKRGDSLHEFVANPNP